MRAHGVAIERCEERLDDVVHDRLAIRERRVGERAPENDDRLRDVIGPVTAPGVRPVDDVRAVRRQQHVLRMEIEVQQRVPFADRGEARRCGDLVQTLMQRGEQSDVAIELGPIGLERFLHRRPVDALEHHVRAGHLLHFGNGIAVCTGVAHDVDFVLGDIAPLVMSEHRVLVERVHARIPSASEDRRQGLSLGARSESGYALTTYVPAILSCQPCPCASNAAQIRPMKSATHETTKPPKRMNAPM